jgi:hypothetical protein
MDTAPTNADPAADLDRRVHAEWVRSIVDKHRQWVRANQDDFGLANAMLHTEFWSYYNGYGQRKFGSKWKFKVTGEETEDNRIQREVQTYNAALVPDTLKCNVKPDPQGRGKPEVKSAMLNLWLDHPDQKEAIRDLSEISIVHPFGALMVAIEEGTGKPEERVYIEAVPPWETVVDRDARTRRGARYVGRLYQSPESDVRARYGADLRKLGCTVHGGPRVDVLHGGTMDPTTSQTARSSVPGSTSEDFGADDRFVSVLELCNFRASVAGPSGATYRGRLEVWILDQGGKLEQVPIAVTMLPFAGANGEPNPHIFPNMYMHEAPYVYRGKAPIARLIPLNIALNRMNLQIFRDTQRNQRKQIARKGAFGQDQAGNLFDEVDKETAWTDSEKPFQELIYNIPHQAIAPDTFQFRNIIDQMLGRQQGPNVTAQGQITGATAYEVQQSQLFTEATFKYHAWMLAQTLTRAFGAVLRAFIIAGVDTSDSVGGSLNEGEVLAPTGSVDVNAMSATEGNAAAERATKPKIPSAGWAAYEIEYNGEHFIVDRDALDGACEVVYTQNDRTPITDQGVVQFLSGPGGQAYEQRLQAGFKGDVFSLEVAEQIATRAGLPKNLHPGEVRRRMEEAERKTPTPAAEVARASLPPEEEPPAPEAPQPPPTQDGPLAPVVGLLTDAFEALRTVAVADPGNSAALQAAGKAIQMAMEAANAGDAEGLRTSILAASQALSAVEIQAPEIDMARKNVATVVRAVAADTLPDTRQMDTGVGAPTTVSKEETNAGV